MSLTLLVFMALASYRLWRIVGQDSWSPSVAFREWLAEYVRSYEQRAAAFHGTVTGERYTRLAERLATILELIECPWCLGSWIAGLVVLIVDLVVGLALPLLQWGAVACAVGFLGAIDGALSG